MTTKYRKVYEEIPFEIVDADNDLYEKSEIPNLPQFRGVLVGPKKYYFHPCFKKCGLDFYNFKSRPDDVWILGIMRSGTTLISELTYLLVNDLNFKNAANTELVDRIPTLESYLAAKTFIGHKSEYGFGPIKLDMNAFMLSQFTKTLDALKSRRCIRSHLPISLVSPHIFDVGAKVIYCARNPKDVIVSNYHFYRLFQDDYFNSFEKYFKMFKSNALAFLPYFEHLKEGWAKRNDPNFLFIFYEDMLRDKQKSIKRISEFLDIDITDEGVNELVDHLDIKNFKKNKSVNLENMQNMGFTSKKESFVRKGQVGGWKKYFQGDLEKEVDDWIEENLKGTDIKFPVS